MPQVESYSIKVEMREQDICLPKIQLEEIGLAQGKDLVIRIVKTWVKEKKIIPWNLQKLESKEVL